jgi:peptidoglycan/xylan/chitin deacetylase (PgdA/CDA1 family)
MLLFAATAALLALTGYAVLARPPPLGWAVFGLVGYAGLLLGGVLMLPWRVFVDALVRGPKGARGVVLTFDDGPHPRWTRAVLDVLASRGAKATFFVVGRKAEEHPDVVRAIVAQGHSVGLHSYAHDRLLSLRTERRVRADLERGIAVLAGIVGSRPSLFRPPVGHTNPNIARVAADLDLTVVAWTVRGLDGLAGARPADVAARIDRGLRDGAIVLLHDAAERGDREPAAVKALPAILEAIAARGLEVVPLQAWAGAPAAVEDPAGSST